MGRWNKTYHYGLTVSPAFNANLGMVQQFLFSQGILPANSRYALLRHTLKLAIRDTTQKQVQEGQVTLKALGVSPNV